MATIVNEINETNKKISQVKKIIKKKADSLIDHVLLQTPISKGKNWKQIDFSKPQRTIRIGTMFSGIGAIEHAFQRLGLKHKIVFAGDIEPKCKTSYFANYEIEEKNGLLTFEILMLSHTIIR